MTRKESHHNRLENEINFCQKLINEALSEGRDHVTCSVSTFCDLNGLNKALKDRGYKTEMLTDFYYIDVMLKHSTLQCYKS